MSVVVHGAGNTNSALLEIYGDRNLTRFDQSESFGNNNAYAEGNIVSGHVTGNDNKLYISMGRNATALYDSVETQISGNLNPLN